MDIKDCIEELDKDFFTKIPHAQLRILCNYLAKYLKISDCYLNDVNKKNIVALATQQYLETGKIPIVNFMNSDLCSMINSLSSFLNQKAFVVPCIFMIGWRCEPKSLDKEQSSPKSEITLELLNGLGIETFLLSENTSENVLHETIKKVKLTLDAGESVAFVICKNYF